VRGAEAPSLARDRRIRRGLADAGGVAASEDRRQRCRLVRIQVGDGRFEVGRVVAVVVPLPIRILIARIDRSVDQRHKRRQGICVGKIRD
jgi:hypothetical protein